MAEEIKPYCACCGNRKGCDCFSPQSSQNRKITELKQWVCAIESEPEYPENIWRELGFWKALKLTVWMICHPYRNTRLTARTVKDKLLRSVPGWSRELGARA